MTEDVLIFSGQDKKLLQKQERERHRLQKELNRQYRAKANEDKKNAERAKNQKPIFIKQVEHKPAYSILSWKRKKINYDGELIDSKPDFKNFKTTPAFTSKSEIQSMKSQSRLKNAIGWLLLFADKKRVFSKVGKFNVKTGKQQHNFYFRLAFITLTLSDDQIHDDEYIKEHLLQPFLYWITRYYNANYVWKAESQLNGNIHFHITVDTFIPWKSVRAKWNKLLAKHGYCKVLQDGSNDKGDAATQIKSVLKESHCAKDIGGYMSKKDNVTKKDQKAIEDNKPGYEKANVHCKWNSINITQNHDKTWSINNLIEAKQDLSWYKRVIDGRLWGCSENLSGVNVFIDETYPEFQKEETIFFRQNPDIYNLGAKVIQREKEKYSKKDEAERAVMGMTDEDIEQRYRFMNNVFIHKHLSEMKKGCTLQKIIHEEKMNRQKNFQTFFRDN